MVIAAQYESLLHPFVIMFTLPLSFVGVAWTLFLTGTTLSVNSIIGVIVLAGVVVDNAILLVDYTNLLRGQGAGPRGGRGQCDDDADPPGADDRPDHDAGDVPDGARASGRARSSTTRWQGRWSAGWAPRPS